MCCALGLKAPWLALMSLPAETFGESQIVSAEPEPHIARVSRAKKRCLQAAKLQRALEYAGQMHTLPSLEGALRLSKHHRCEASGCMGLPMNLGHLRDRYSIHDESTETIANRMDLKPHLCAGAEELEQTLLHSCVLAANTNDAGCCICVWACLSTSASAWGSLPSSQTASSSYGHIAMQCNSPLSSSRTCAPGRQV